LRRIDATYRQVIMSSVSQKSRPPPEFFCNIFTQAKYIFKSNFAESLLVYLFIYLISNSYKSSHNTNFGRFILIFNEMALIFLGVLIILRYQVSTFSESNCRDFIVHDKWSQFTWPQSSRFSGLGAMLESYHRLQENTKTLPECSNALKLIWSALPEKTIDNSVKDYHKRLQACVSANDGHFEQIMW